MAVREERLKLKAELAVLEDRHADFGASPVVDPNRPRW